MAYFFAFIIGAGWGIIVHDLCVINARKNTGDELGLSEIDYLTAEKPYYEDVL